MCFSSDISVENIAAMMREMNVVKSCAEIIKVELSLRINNGPLYVCSVAHTSLIYLVWDSHDSGDISRSCQRQLTPVLKHNLTAQ